MSVLCLSVCLCARAWRAMLLSAADLEFFAEHGWVVARNVIDAAQAKRTAQEVWEFAGVDPLDADSW